MYYIKAYDTGNVYLAVPNPGDPKSWVVIPVGDGYNFKDSIPMFGYATEALMYQHFTTLPGIETV